MTSPGENSSVMYLRRTPCNLPFGQRVRFLDYRFHTSNSYLLKRREPSPHSLLHRIVKTTQASIRNRRNRKFMIQPPPHNPTITDPHNLIPRTLESMRDISPHVEHLNTLPRHITQTIRLHALLPRNPISVLERILPILKHLAVNEPHSINSPDISPDIAPVCI
jgi:hypothetical protein